MAVKGYTSDLSDAQWALVEPHIPPARSGGRSRRVDIRAVVNAIFYLLRTGCQWRLLPKDFPPWGTVWWYFRRWRREGVWVRMHRALYPLARAKTGRRPGPGVVIMDGQSVKTTEKGRSRLRWAQGREGPQAPHPGRHVGSADRQPGRTGQHVGSAGRSKAGGWPLAALADDPHRHCRRRSRIADAGHASRKLAAEIKRHEGWRLVIVRRSEPAFKIVGLNWIVERTFDWLGRHRRLSKDYEYKVQTSETLIKIAAIRTMLSRLAPA